MSQLLRAIVQRVALQATRRLLVPCIGALFLLLPLEGIGAQYFGQNRVRWESFDVRVMRTEHFDIHYERAAEPTVREMARKAERWYTRLAFVLNHQFTTRKPLILYTNHPDFQQTTLANTPLSEGTRGFAEGVRDRLVMPLTGVGAENDHVLGHEIAHLFQFDLAEPAGGAAAMIRLPLWFVEGMAEYLTLGSDDANTAMWLRAALAEGTLPTLAQLTMDPRVFPYRYGHAFWAYVGGRWGDEAVAALYRRALRDGITIAVPRTLGISAAELESWWHESIRLTYEPIMMTRESATAIGRAIGTDNERLAVSPHISPDGTLLAYIGQDALGRVDVRVREVATGRMVRSLLGAASDGHTDAIAFLYASGAWSPDSRRFAQVVVRRGDSELAILEARSGRLERRLRVPRVQAISAVSWSPDGRQLAIAGSRDGQGDLFLYDLQEDRVQALTSDGYAELHPAWSPDGRWIAIATDRHEETDLSTHQYGRLRLALIDPVGGRVRALPDLGPRTRAINPQWSGDGRSLYFVGEVDGIADLFRLDMARGVFDQLTQLRTGISGITPRSPALTVASSGEIVVTAFASDGFRLIQIDPARVTTYQRLAEREVVETTPIIDELGGVLPPNVASPSPIVDELLANGETGLPGPTAGVATTRRYRGGLKLEGVGVPSAGVTAGANGSAVGGGASIFWGDLLARRRLGIVMQAQGRIEDAGGQLFYLNSASRWNLFATLGRVPQSATSARAISGEATGTGGQRIPVTLIERGLIRTIAYDATAGAQYPFSRTRRVEFAATGTRLSQSFQATRELVDGNSGRILDRGRVQESLGPAVQFAQASMAVVGDDAVFGITSPLAGWRYRFELAQTIGRIQYASYTADARWYRPTWRGSLAVRTMMVGRGGRDAQNGALAPLSVAGATLVRGYAVDTWATTECPRGLGIACPQADNLFGSRLAVFNTEYRLPLARLGLRGVPVELAPFIDAGLAWRAGDAVRWSGPVQGGASRRPVLSHGITTRLNAGALIVEFFYARPLQRQIGGTFGLSLAPGW